MESTSTTTPTLRVCARHETIAAPRACACGAPLCTACARHKAHQSCPHCSAAPVDKRAQWYAILLVDTLIEGRRAIPARAATFVVTLLGISVLGLLTAHYGFDAKLRGSLLVELGAGALAGIFAIGWIVQPTAWIPLARPLSLPRTVSRAAPLGLVFVVVIAFALLLVGGAIGGLDALDAPLALTVVVAILAALLVFALCILALPYACGLFSAAIFRGGVLARARRPGWRAFWAMGVAHMACATLGYSVGVMPIAMGGDFVHEGALFLVFFALVGAFALVLNLTLMGAFVGATWRYLSDLRDA